VTVLLNYVSTMLSVHVYVRTYYFLFYVATEEAPLRRFLPPPRRPLGPTVLDAGVDGGAKSTADCGGCSGGGCSGLEDKLGGDEGGLALDGDAGTGG